MPNGVEFGRIAATVPVIDIGRALGFYVDILGFSKAFENGNPVGFVILKVDSAELHSRCRRRIMRLIATWRTYWCPMRSNSTTTWSRTAYGSSREFATPTTACAALCSPIPTVTASTLGSGCKAPPYRCNRGRERPLFVFSRQRNTQGCQYHA
jgi:hypothetical protein